MAMSCHVIAPTGCFARSRKSLLCLSSQSISRSLTESGFPRKAARGKSGHARVGKNSLTVCSQQGTLSVALKDDLLIQNLDSNAAQLSIVMKFGGSSVASAERMKEVANLILSFPDESPVIVLSAMGKSTNKLLLVRSNSSVNWNDGCFSVLHCLFLIGRREGCQLRYFSCIRN